MAKLSQLNLIYFETVLNSLDYKNFCSFKKVCHLFCMDFCLKFEKIQNAGVCCCLMSYSCHF